MADYTPYQRKLIGRYYEHRDDISLTRLQEIVTELTITDSEKRTTSLWSRADKAMAALQVPQQVRDQIVTQADPEILARHVRDWLSAGRTKQGNPPAK
jgi:hypothetical protein